MGCDVRDKAHGLDIEPGQLIVMLGHGNRTDTIGAQVERARGLDVLPPGLLVAWEAPTQEAAVPGVDAVGTARVAAKRIQGGQVRRTVKPQTIGAHPGAIVLGTTCKRVVKTGAFEHARVAEHELVDGGATGEHAGNRGGLGHVPSGKVERDERRVPGKHPGEVGDGARVPICHRIVVLQVRATCEHACKRGRRRSVPLIDTRDRGERPVVLEHARKIGRTRHIHVRTIEAREARMVGKPVGGVLQDGRAVGIDGQHVCQAGDILPGELVGSLGNGLV